MSSSDDEKNERLADTIGSVMAFVANETVLLSRMEEFFSPEPAKLWSDDQYPGMIQELDNAVDKMGGLGTPILVREDAPPPEVDTYPEAILHELISAFHRSRKSVCRAHMFMIGAKMQGEHPEWLENTSGKEISSNLLLASEKAFWEHAETAYIRLASYWDRVGQVLDFAFFRIRQFERDGFSAVMDKIRTNVVHMYPHFEASGSWKALRKYQSSEKEDGLKWLLRRRNITVHSLHLRPADSRIDEIDFKPMYNHLEEKLKSKLSPRTPVEEVELLHKHLHKAASLFREVLNVVEYSEYVLGRPIPRRDQ